MKAFQDPFGHFRPLNTLDLEVGIITSRLIQSFVEAANQHVDDVAERMGQSREYIAAHFQLEEEFVLEQQDDRSFVARISGQLVPRKR